METPKYILLAVGSYMHATTVVPSTSPSEGGSGAHVEAWAGAAGREEPPLPLLEASASQGSS